MSRALTTERNLGEEVRNASYSRPAGGYGSDREPVRAYSRLGGWTGLARAHGVSDTADTAVHAMSSSGAGHVLCGSHRLQLRWQPHHSRGSESTALRWNRGHPGRGPEQFELARLESCSDRTRHIRVRFRWALRIFSTTRRLSL